MPLILSRFYLQPSLARHYEALAVRAGVSRSLLVRYALEKALPAVEKYVASGKAAAARAAEGEELRRRRSEAAHPAPLPRSDLLEDPKRLRGAVQEMVYRQLLATPNLEPEAVRRLVASNVASMLGGPADPEIFDEAVDLVLRSRPNDPPRPVGGNRPPE